MSSNDILFIIFGIVFIFVVKKIISIFNARKNLQGEVISLALRGRKLLMGLSFALVVFGTAYAISTRDITSVIYIVIGVCYMIISTDKLYIGENGFCCDGKFIEFKKIKKFNFYNKKFYEVISAGDLKDETSTIPLIQDTADEFTKIIKSKKSKPKAKK